MSRLEELFQKYYSKTATEAECAELFSLIPGSAKEDKEELASIISTTAINAQLKGKELDPGKVEGMIQSIIKSKKTASPVVHRAHFPKETQFRLPISRLAFRWASAAAILIVLTGAFLYYKFSSTSQVNPGLTEILAKTDVQPGFTRAMLTLSNGEKVELDSTASETIKDGNLSIENNNGQLIYKNQGVAAMNTMSTPKGGQYQLTLADGTKVWLNAVSSITFPTAFNGNNRQVKVNGEVYFEVAQDNKRPFIVDVDGKSTVEVLGTAFNINSYTNEDGIKTSLVNGSVKVIKGNKAVVLQPGNQAVVAALGQGSHDNDNTIRVQPADIGQVLAWKNGLFNFNGADLKAVIRQLERWYDIEARYEGPISKTTFSGKMYRNVNLSDVLEVFRDLGIKFRMEGKTLVITGWD